MTGRSEKYACAAPPLVEALEQRLLLASGALISEFMADNVSARADGDGRFSDWIELYNPSAVPIDLGGWYLTDSLQDLTRWRFPSLTIQPGAFALVFASGRGVGNYVDAGGYLHTNFQLNADGESLALVMPDGRTIAQAFRDFPPQLPDVSYGLTGLATAEESLVSAGHAVSYHVPTAGEDAASWTAREFDDGGWVHSYTRDAAGLLITEVSTGQPRFVEVQNVSDATVAAAGWRILVNSASGGINAVNAAAWPLPAGVAAGQVLYRTDDPADHYWGAPIDWAAEGNGWVMILDSAGQVADFVAWGYTAAQIASLDVSYGGFSHIRVAGQWSGDGAAVGTASGGPATEGWVAYNDHVIGAGTHANTTAYSMRGTRSGLLRDVATGLYTDVTLSVTAAGPGYAKYQGEPYAGTDAYGLFHGYVTFGYGTDASIELKEGEEDHYTYTFSGLDTGDTVTYDFAGTAVRGTEGSGAPYPTRWTRVTLFGAVSATPAHSTGVGVVILSDTEVAIWTGDNSQANQGFVARWTDIDPGPDGSFAVISEQYRDEIPTTVDPSGWAGGDKGYGITGIRLEETASAVPMSYLRRVGGTDGGTAGDFVRDSACSLGVQNPDMIVPFGTVVPAVTGLGYSDGDVQFDALIAADVGQALCGVNASLWVRVAFDGGDLAGWNGLALRMKYDDGFVAYLNGQEVARRNAPPVPAWDSAATEEHPNAQAVVFETIDISAFLGLLRAKGNVLAIHAMNVGAADGDLLVLPELVVLGTSYDPRPSYFLAPTPLGPNGLGYEYPGVRINEIHTDPDVKTELVEFIELYNGGPDPVNVGGWYFSDGVSYTFPAGAVIPANGYVVVAQNPAQFQAKFGRPAYGPWVGSLDNDGEKVTLRNAAFQVVDSVDYGLGFPWPIVGDAPGRSIQLITPALDGDLGGSWRSAAPTPGQQNACYAQNAAPQMRQVLHAPRQPVGGQDVKITVKVTDPNGVASVKLQYQLVDPGSYIEYTSAAYQTNWVEVPMTDDGTGGDDRAGDGVYTAVMPGSLQAHRRLVRYRITATDASADALSIMAPYADDAGLNFAYYVYDGVPSWSGAIHPGDADPAKAQVVEYASEALTSVPVYQLITTRKAHEDSQYIPYSTRTSGYGGMAYLWVGTLVYDGEVYDNIRYRARGGVWRYSMGKNMWKFDFNRGHYFQAVDDYGRKYDTKWDKLNFSAIIQQGNFLQRGEQGLFEAVGFKLHNLAGNEAAYTHYVHFRIVESADENGANQYGGDFQGLYLVIEQPDGNFLDEHGLPDGNLYKMEGGTGTLNNQGPTQPSDRSDLDAFMNTYKTYPSTDWWKANLDLEDYYSFYAVVTAIHDNDIHANKNYFFYHDPETGKWSVHNWDLDLTWTTTYRLTNLPDDALDSYVFGPNVEFQIAYRNRMREIRDLLFNPEQVGWMIDEIASVVYTPGQPSLVDADRAMWDYNPILVSSYVRLDKAGHGKFYEYAPSRTFAGMMQVMKNYVVSRGAWIDSTILTDESLVPNKPTVWYVGPAGRPLNQLTFRCSPFSDATGSFAAMEWRIAEVTDPSAPAYDPAEPIRYEMTAIWESGELPVYASTVTVPPAGLEEGHAYRVRVRMKDSTGRWSHWSAPVQFIAGAATGTALTESLRVTEIMYDPAPDPSGTYQQSEFEFIELRNTGAATLNLSGVSFTKGIAFSFAGSAVTSLAPGERVVVVRNCAAFAARYGATGIPVAGFYTGKLDDDGETIELADATDGLIQSFRYDGSWYDQAGGEGFSVAIVDDAAAAETWSLKANWKASWTFGGTPGLDDAGLAPGSVVISEVLAHTDEPDGDWIELHNTTDQPIDVGGWFLSDAKTDVAGNSALGRYRIPTDRPGETTIPAGGHVVLTAQAFFGSAFALSEHGDDVYLTGDDNGQPGGYREHVDFGASPNGRTFGLHVKGNGETDFTLLDLATPGGPNAAPYVGLLVLSEVMYAPPGGLYEYVELYNRTSSAVPLYDPDRPGNTWRIAGGVEFAFPGGLSVAPHGCVLITETDPETFRAAYGLGPEVAVYGPYTGKLDNAGEDVRLERPDRPDPVTGFVPYIREDWVRYDNDSPWPLAAAGQGASLSRIRSCGYGNDLGNWEAGGTPGEPNVPPPAVVDFHRNGGQERPSELFSVSFRFSQDVSESLSVEDLSAHNVSTGQPVDLAAATLTYDKVNHIARWDLSAVPVQPGYHTLVLSHEGVVNLEGLPLGGPSAGDYELTLLVAVPGDADLDGTVSRADLLVLKAHYGQAQASWSWGDFDYDGTVGLLDYLAVKENYGRKLAAPAPAGASGAGEQPAAAPAADPPVSAAQALPASSEQADVLAAPPAEADGPAEPVSSPASEAPDGPQGDGAESAAAPPPSAPQAEPEAPSAGAPPEEWAGEAPPVETGSVIACARRPGAIVTAWADAPQPAAAERDEVVHLDGPLGPGAALEGVLVDVLGQARLKAPLSA